MNEFEHLETIMVRNPASGQILQTTKKVFHSIYLDKGFEIVTRDNVANGVTSSGRKSGEKRRSEPASVNGSAAAIAAGLGLDQAAGAGSMTFDEAAAKYKEIQAGAADGEKLLTPSADNAETGVAIEGKKDENAVNTDGPAVTPERQPVKRDRGRNS
jgi:hypothetical protein